MEANTFHNEKTLRKLWVEWKARYLEAHKDFELHIRAYGDKEPFNGANTGTKVPANSNRSTAPSNTNIDRLDSYLKNIAKAATNEKAVLK